MPYSIVLILVALSLGCSEERSAVGPDLDSGAAKVAVSLANLAAAGRVEGVVTAADMDTLRVDLTVGTDRVARGVLSPIPVGTERRIELSVYSSDGLRTHGGFAGGLTVTESDTLEVAIALLPLSGAVGVTGTILDSNETVTYLVVFDATWSSATHPKGFPSVPHFSGLIGVNHNSNASFWTAGAAASEGIKDMAEEGKKVTLQGEFAVARRHGNAGTDISGGGVNPTPGSVTLEFEVERRFPLVTLVSMVAPSPDWFVGTSGLSLLDEAGNWKRQAVAQLFAYDAGTDGGVSYSSPNQALEPRLPIAALGGAPFLVEGSVPPLGTFTFVKR